MNVNFSYPYDEDDWEGVAFRGYIKPMDEYEARRVAEKELRLHGFRFASKIAAQLEWYTDIDEWDGIECDILMVDGNDRAVVNPNEGSSSTYSVSINDSSPYDEGDWYSLTTMAPSRSEAMDTAVEALRCIVAGSKKNASPRSVRARRKVADVTRDGLLDDFDFRDELLDFGVPEQVVNLLEENSDLDNFLYASDVLHYENVFNEEDLGRAYVDSIGGPSNLEKDTLMAYFDYEAYGRDFVLDGDFILDNGMAVCLRPHSS